MAEEAVVNQAELEAEAQSQAATDKMDNVEERMEETEFVVEETQGVVENLESIASSLESILESGGSLDGAGFKMYDCAMKSNLRRLGINYQEKLPALESFEDPITRRGATKIALEGVLESIGDAVEAIWKWIMGLIKSVIDWLGFGKSKNEAVVKKVEVIEKKIEAVEEGKVASYKEFKLLPEQTQTMLKAAKEADKGIRRAEYNAKQAEKSPPAVVEAAKSERKFKIDRSYKATVVLDEEEIKRLWINGWKGENFEGMFEGKANGFVALVEAFRGDFQKNIDNAFSAIFSALGRGEIEGLESGFKAAKSASNEVVGKFINAHGPTSFGGFNIIKGSDKDGNMTYEVVGHQDPAVKDMTVSINFNDLKKLIKFVGNVDDYDDKLAGDLERYQKTLEIREKEAVNAAKKLRGDEKGDMKGAKTALMKQREAIQVLTKFVTLVRLYRLSLAGAIATLPSIAQDVATQSVRKSLEAVK